jgi:hypothetical protein
MEPLANFRSASDPGPDRPGRHRGADLVEEARIARAGGGIRRLSPYYQALLYVVLLATLLGGIWLVWSSARP